MSITDAIGAYDASFFGSGSSQVSHGGGNRYDDGCCSSSHSSCCIWISSSGSGSKSDEGACACLVLIAALAAAVSAAIFAYFSVDSYKTAAEMGNFRRSADDQDPTVKKDIKKVFSYLEAERALTGTAYLSAAAGLSILIVACALVLMKKPEQQYMKFAIAGGAVTGAFIPFFGLSFAMNPSNEVKRLRKVAADRQPPEPTPERGPVRVERRLQAGSQQDQHVITPSAPHVPREPPPPYRENG